MVSQTDTVLSVGLVLPQRFLHKIQGLLFVCAIELLFHAQGRLKSFQLRGKTDIDVYPKAVLTLRRFRARCLVCNWVSQPRTGPVFAAWAGLRHVKKEHQNNYGFIVVIEKLYPQQVAEKKSLSAHAES